MLWIEIRLVGNGDRHSKIKKWRDVFVAVETTTRNEKGTAVEASRELNW